MIKRAQKGDRWSREEMIVVFNLYFKLAYGQLDHRTPAVIELANLIGRTANSVAMRLNNFASCDPIHIARGVKSLGDHKKLVQPYWDEFLDNQEALVYESEQILVEYQGLTMEQKFEAQLKDIPKGLKGEDRIQEVKTRVNQSFFRRMVLANYGEKCALTGIDIPELLVASHIIPWAHNERERLNPANGICLSSLYDRAFDQGLIAFDNDGKVLLSEQLKRNEYKEYYSKYFQPIATQKLADAINYRPNPSFLEWHRDVIFNKGVL